MAEKPAAGKSAVARPEAQERLLSELNQAQREAVASTEGPLLVLAGAGTGKTRVITYRVANLLLRDVPAEAILGVTFTNKAAKEMRERVGALIKRDRAKGVTLSTFHALGVRILRAESEAIGLRRNFTIYDTSNQLSLLRTVMRDIKGPVSTGAAREVLAKISLAKNRFVTPEDLIEEASDDLEYMIATVYARYQEAFQQLNCVDFDDLIRLPVELLQEHDDIRERYQRRFRYLMVDEYQDTNGAQYRFTQALVSPLRNICVVGDDDQSIYGFRGAEMDKILRFESDFPGAKVVKLEENYRSTGCILNLANAVISVNSERHPKELRSTLGRGSPVVWVATPDSESEVDYVVREVVEQIEQARRTPNDIAILFRSAIQARPFEEKFRLRRVPYRLIGGQSYYDRKEIRDAVAYWNVAHNRKDDLSLLRIINTPRRGFGAKSVEQLNELAGDRQLSLYDALELAAAEEGAFTPRVRSAARSLVAAFQRARELESEGKFGELCRGLLEDVSYHDALAELYTDPLTLQTRWAAIEDLFESVDRHEASGENASFGQFLQALTLETDGDRNEEDQRRGVVLQTLHSAKGLEYPVVFLVGVEENMLPHRKSVEDGDRGIEEERRLFYVGITRARQRLILTSSESRRSYGQDHVTLPSRFLTELEDGSLFQHETFETDSSVAAEDGRAAAEEYFRMIKQQGGGPAKGERS